MERRLAVILAADVVGYSAQMERDEAGTFARLVAGRKELFEPEIARHHGRIFKLMGDGLLAEFGSVVDAVECAVSLQRGLAERNLSIPESERIQVRIGVNLGEVIVEGDDRYGEGVNIATRLEQLAKAGDVYVSGKVAKEVEKKLAFGFEPMGEQKVKNISEPVAVYRVNIGNDTKVRTATRPSAAKRVPLIAGAIALLLLVAVGASYGFYQWQKQSAGLVLPDKPSIAVLPFANLSDDPQQGYFADGIAEDLMTALSRMSGLFVVSRNSAFAYKGKSVDLREVGRELGVRHVLEGSVRRAGDTVRINVQLIDTTTGGHQWAERYEGSQEDIFALQDQVTKAVVAALALQLTPGEQAALNQRDTHVPEAYDAFLRGWEHYQRTTPQDYVKAIPHFEQAIALDPNYGRAHAALAMTYFRSFDQRWAGTLGLTADDAFRKARDALKLAQAHPTSLSHQVAGNIARERGWYDEAIKELEAAILLEPGDSWSYADLAHTLIWAGRPAEAVEKIEAAMRLDPHYPPVFAFYLGLAQFAQGQFDEAAKTFEEMQRLNPDAPWVGLYLAAAYGNAGREKDAAAAVASFSAARVRQGGFPFFMDELQGNIAQYLFKFPERAKLIQGINVAKIPRNFASDAFDELRLTGSEIEELVFGHRLHGRLLGRGEEYGASVTIDGGTAILFGNWGNRSGSARIDGDRICFVFTATEFCGEVLRNPGGTRAKENEFILFADDWPTPFSQVD
jgi:TolB-like protein/class 3 adenylate cyclase/Flp pilus assembly protein TadD